MSAGKICINKKCTHAIIPREEWGALPPKVHHPTEAQKLGELIPWVEEFRAVEAARGKSL